MLIFKLPLEDVLSHPDLAKRYCLLGSVQLQTSESKALPSIVPEGLLQRHNIVLGPLTLGQVDEVRPWLHNGARKAFFAVPRETVVEHLKIQLAGLPRERVGVSVVLEGKDAVEADAVAGGHFLEHVTKLYEVASSVQINFGNDSIKSEEALISLANAIHHGIKCQGATSLSQELVVEAPASMQWSAEGIKALNKESIRVLLHGAPSEKLNCHRVAGVKELVLPLKQAAVDGVGAFLACLRTDRLDGLFTTVVVDECNVALGLVYSSAESVRTSVAELRGVYFSRSRGGLWRKGDSSGAVQELVGLDVDCDSDALRFVVRQRGKPPAFCHLNRRSCWQEDRGLGALQRTLEDRLHQAVEGSYTQKLFRDPDLLRHKLVEEAQELSEAKECEDVAAEAADVFYFAMVRCVAAGVTLEDIERHLDARTLKLQRRPGNAKAHRIDAAEKILSSPLPSRT